MSNKSLEEQKLELEIRDLSRPYLLRPQVLATFSPIVAGLIAFGGVLLTLWWDDRQELVKKQLETETQRVACIKSLSEAHAKIVNMTNKRFDLQEKLIKVKQEGVRLQEQNNILQLLTASEDADTTSVYKAKKQLEAEIKSFEASKEAYYSKLRSTSKSFLNITSEALEQRTNFKCPSSESLEADLEANS